ncbi:MAG: glycosyltransferase family 39 protein [Chloroflexi bacterium]|nr:glycosyltransferase family 39 protein [Chloroflexota bacterium]
MEEPSVLDYVKSRLMPWRGVKIEIPAAGEEAAQIVTAQAEIEAAADEPPAAPVVAPPLDRAAALTAWLALGAFGAALIAQRSLEPRPERDWLPGAVLYLLSAWLLLWSHLRQWKAQPDAGEQPASAAPLPALTLRPLAFTLAAILGAAAFLTLGGNRFTLLNVTLWALAAAGMVWAFWQSDRSRPPWTARWSAWVKNFSWQVSFSPWSLLLLGAALIVLFFRLYRLDQVPVEMVSDHAEKLLDVWDVLQGQAKIFFERNTGREAMQMYLTAAIARYGGSGLSFMSLKLGTALAGLLTLPYIYLLGKELGGRQAGLYALLLAGFGYWPNVIARAGLRFPLYPLFAAPALYYLLRGLRTAHMNDFLLAGLALGIGLHGYTPMRIVPFLVAAAAGVYWLHRQPPGHKARALVGLAALSAVTLFAFLPLLRFSLENPDLFAFRSLSRLGSLEQPLPGPAWQIFLSNTWRALTMFAWDDGEIWVHSVTHRPALDVVSGALFYTGAALLALRYLRRRDWQDLTLLLAVPILLLPSILSLAFPAENPALNRMGGAIAPVFVIAAIALDGVVTRLRAALGGTAGKAAAWLVALALLVFSAYQNYDLVFRQYAETYRSAAWNTSEMGEVIRDYAASIGSADTAWVVAFPHWVDTRLVGVNAGYPTRDYAIALENLALTQAEGRAKLFLVKPDDVDALAALRSLYPAGILELYESQVEGHHFYLFFVPPVTQ